MLHKRRLAKKIELMMVQEELELHDLSSQHNRAYHTGVIDGLGQALFTIDKKRARRNTVSIVWFDEDFDEQRIVEQDREVAFDATHQALIFATAESD
jgi:stress-induced morphogen